LTEEQFLTFVLNPVIVQRIRTLMDANPGVRLISIFNPISQAIVHARVNGEDEGIACASPVTQQDAKTTFDLLAEPFAGRAIFEEFVPASIPEALRN